MAWKVAEKLASKKTDKVTSSDKVKKGESILLNLLGLK